MLPPSIQVRKGPGQVFVKVADGKPHSVERREASLPYTFDDFRSDDDYLVIAMNYAIDCMLDMPWLAHYKPQIYWPIISMKCLSHLLLSLRNWRNVCVVDREFLT